MSAARRGERSKPALASAAKRAVRATDKGVARAKTKLAAKTKPVAKSKLAAKTKPAAKTKAAKAKPLALGPNSTDAAFLKVRELCLALPDTKLTMTWGSPHFRVGEKIFCGFGGEDGKQVLGVKLAPSHARNIVREPRFWPAPYVGKHGWVSLDVAKRKSWNEVAALIHESYRLIAPKASLAKLR